MYLGLVLLKYYKEVDTQIDWSKVATMDLHPLLNSASDFPLPSS
jgi:hypothetical protein